MIMDRQVNRVFLLQVMWLQVNINKLLLQLEKGPKQLCQLINIYSTKKASQEQLFVEQAVDSLGGKIIEWVYDDQRRLTDVVAEIPTDRVEAFRKKMGELGEVTGVPVRFSATDRRTVTVRVRIRR